MYEIVIQIVNYNTKKYLRDLLVDLFRDLDGTSINYKISILDNCSADDLSDLARLYEGNPRISFFKSDRNRGYGGGHNLLAQKEQARYLLLLNPDLKFIEEKTIPRLLARIREDPERQVIGPKLVTPGGSVQWWDHGELSGILAWIALHSGVNYWRKRRGLAVVAWVSGAVFLVEKETFDGVGGFDEKFFLYKEEEDLCWRIRERGGVIIYDPTISIMHYGGVVAEKHKYMRASTEYFLEKHFKHSELYPFLKIFNHLIH